MRDPTAFADLNDVLRELVDGARAALAPNFCGAYLHGSFALGAADHHSDVDFLVATHGEVTAEQEARLQELHARLYARGVEWAQHLEGSYVPKQMLRYVDPSRTSCLYLDNGASVLVRDDHCNTALVRWVLREHGIVLAGPAPRRLIEPVSAEQLKAEARANLVAYAAWAPEPSQDGPMSRWKQPYLVLTFCRMLHTLDSGRIVPKAEAARWGLGALDRKWAPLLQQAVADRPHPWLRVHQPADPEAVAATLAFIEYALLQSNSY